MFVVTEAEAAAIRAVYEQRGEFSAAVELRRLFPGVTDNAQARECARTIAGWKPLPKLPLRRLRPEGSDHRRPIPRPPAGRYRNFFSDSAQCAAGPRPVRAG